MCYYLIVIIIANYCWWLFMNDNNNNYGGFGNSAGVLYVNPDVFNNALSVFPVDTVTALRGGLSGDSSMMLTATDMLVVGDHYFFDGLYGLAEDKYTTALQKALLVKTEPAEQLGNAEQVISCVNALGILYMHMGRVDDAEKLSGMYSEYFDTVFY